MQNIHGARLFFVIFLVVMTSSVTNGKFEKIYIFFLNVLMSDIATEKFTSNIINSQIENIKLMLLLMQKKCSLSK